jgi:hypothetical protein
MLTGDLGGTATTEEFTRAVLSRCGEPAERPDSPPEPPLD